MAYSQQPTTILPRYNRLSLLYPMTPSLPLSTLRVQRCHAAHGAQPRTPAQQPCQKKRGQKNEGGEGNFFQPKHQNMKTISVLLVLRFTHRTNPTTTFINPFQKCFWFFIDFCILSFFLPFVCHTRKILQQTKHLVHFAFFPLFFDLTGFYYASFTKSNDTILTSSYLRVSLTFS
jgi:hypothetical protein